MILDLSSDLTRKTSWPILLENPGGLRISTSWTHWRICIITCHPERKHNKKKVKVIKSKVLNETSLNMSNFWSYVHQFSRYVSFRIFTFDPFLCGYSSQNQLMAAFDRVWRVKSINVTFVELNLSIDEIPLALRINCHSSQLVEIFLRK